MKFTQILLIAIMPFMGLTAFTTKVLSTKPRIVSLEGFLSEEECNYLKEQATPLLKRSLVFAKEGEILDDRRTSQGMFFPQNSTNPILKGIEERICALTKTPRENGEGIQVLCYQKGGEYQPHFDYFDRSIPGGCDRGGQRVATVIMYLHTTEAGGETVFPSAKISVKPVKGNAVLFYNCLPTGEEDPLTLHGGAPVEKGEKWIATKWIREGAFR